jgi:hypothetical protein
MTARERGGKGGGGSALVVVARMSKSDEEDRDEEWCWRGARQRHRGEAAEFELRRLWERD